MVFKSRPIGRRTMLRGMLAGSSFAVGLPILEAMLDTHGVAYADGSPLQPFFMCYSWGSGVGNLRDTFDHWTPSGEGDQWELSENLAPLAPHEDYVTPLTNLRVLGPGSHHEMRATVFSGQFRRRDEYNNNGAYQSMGSDRPSVDQLIGDRLAERPDAPPIHSLVLGMSAVGRHYNGMHRGHSFSWGGGFDLRSPETSPEAIYQQLFSGFSPDPNDGGLTPEAEVELGALDAILSSANRLRDRVGAADRQRLDQHLEGLYETEQAISELAELSCQLPPQPDGDFGPDGASVEPLQLKNVAFSKLIAQAFACGITRSIHYMFCGMQADPVVADVGARDGLHLLTHNDLNGSQNSQPEMIDAVSNYIIARLADTLTELRAIPVGGGNLLDHACIMVASEMMDGRTHSASDGVPLLLIGGGGGRLRAGYHYRAPGDGDDPRRNVSRALLTIYDVMGIDETHIEGGEAQDASDPIDEVLI